MNRSCADLIIVNKSIFYASNKCVTSSKTYVNKMYRDYELFPTRQVYRGGNIYEPLPRLRRPKYRSGNRTLTQISGIYIL